jgi:hypothetical protein
MASVSPMPLNAENPGSALKIPWFEIQPGIVRPNEPVLVTAWIENGSPAALADVIVRLTTPSGIKLANDESASCRIDLKPREPKRLNWHLVPLKSDTFVLEIEATGGTTEIVKRTKSLCVVAQRDAKREFQSLAGDWAPFPARTTLQAGNQNPLAEIASRSSAELKHNLFGITAHLLRDTDGETPFIASHAIDGNLDTCWGSRWWRMEVPLEPEWIKIDLGEVKPAAEVRFLPAWRNSGVPACFTIQTSTDGEQWETVVEQTDFHLQTPAAPELHRGEVAWQCFPFAERPVRFVRLEATRLGQGPTSFFCCPGDPYQLRIAELVLFDKNKTPLTGVQAKASVSTTHTAWYNTPASIAKTTPMLYQSGVKLNRVNQWGDKLDWASVEQTKGQYVIPDDVDRSITDHVKNGVEILLTLDYGNNLYQRLPDLPDVGKSTWFLSHPFLQCAPTTPEAVQAFANYCGFMAKHFKGRVKYFEIWNEENGWFYDACRSNGSVAMVQAYGRALAAAAKAVKEANPEAIVVFGGVAGNSLDFPRIAMQEGAGPYIDVFAFHPYGSPTPETLADDFITQVGERMENRPRPASIKTYEELIHAYKEVFRPYKADMPIWADEMNWFAPGQPPSGQFMFADQSELTQAKYLARFFIMNASLDSAAIWWSLYNANHVQEWAVLRTADCTPRPAFHTAGYVSTVLDDCKLVADSKIEAIGKVSNDLVIKAFRDGSGRLLVAVWRKNIADDHAKPEPVTLALPKSDAVDIFDMLYGYQQSAMVSHIDGGTQIQGLMVGDWPLVVTCTDSH